MVQVPGGVQGVLRGCSASAEGVFWECESESEKENDNENENENANDNENANENDNEIIYPPFGFTALLPVLSKRYGSVLTYLSFLRSHCAASNVFSN